MKPGKEEVRGRRREGRFLGGVGVEHRIRSYLLVITSTFFFSVITI